MKKTKVKKSKELIAIREVSRSVKRLETVYGLNGTGYVKHFYPLISVIETALIVIREEMVVDSQ